MSSTIHPTLLLRMDLDEMQYNENVVAEIKRSYCYIAPVTVVSHPANPKNPENYLRFIVKLRYPYWNSGVEGADEIWDQSMLKWLKSIFYKVSSTLVGINKAARSSGRANLDFAWLELEFGKQVVILHLDANTAIPDEALDLVNKVRQLFNTGLLKELAPATVRIPSRESFDEQKAKAYAQAVAAAAEETDNHVAPTGASDAEHAIANDMAHLARDGAEDRGGESVAGSVAGSEAAEVEVPQASAERPVVFDMDFLIWGLESPDGTCKQYNSDSDSLIA